MQRLLVLLAAALVAACASPSPRVNSYSPKNSPAPTEADRALAADLVREISSLRATVKQGPVAADENYSAVARVHSRDMASGLAPLGVGDGMEARRQAAGLMHSQEIVGARRDTGAGTAKVFVDGWAAEPVRKRALLQASSKIGVGVAHSKDGRAYVTLILAGGGWGGDPLDQLAPAGPGAR